MSTELKLGKNEIYRDAIEHAAKATHLDPRALASLIDLEAAKDDGVWRAASKNPHSSAQGLTQFVSGTWLDEAQKKGRFLHDYARAEGLLDAHGHVLPGKTKELLDLRNKPEIAIMVAAEYAAANYHDLVKKGVFKADTTPDQQARDLYTIHLLGPTGATQYAEGTTTPSAAHRRLQQNGQNITEALLGNNRDLVTAWHAFVDSRLDKIDVTKFQAPPVQQQQPVHAELMR